MDIVKTLILIIGPYLLYALVLKWLEEKQDIELDKFLKVLIFIIADLIILMIFH